MKHPLSLQLSFALWFCLCAAATLPIKARVGDGVGIKVGGHRAGLAAAQATEKNRIKLTNWNDLVYSAKIKLGGKEYAVQIDTGSSDLWIYPGDDDSVPKTNETRLAVGITYDQGTVDGFIAFSDFEFGSYKVSSQAFVDAVEARSLDPLFVRGLSGMLGLSFNPSSKIDAKIRRTWGLNSTLGRTAVSNIFHQYPEAPNFMTVLLGRNEDMDGEVDGVFTLSEYISKYANTIAKQTKLPRREAGVDGALARWNVEMDGLSVSGKAVQLGSKLPNVKQGNLVTMLDTGFSYPQLEPTTADKIYGSFTDGVKLNGSETWIVPCRNTAKVEFYFGGQQVPIHPLDLTAVRRHTFSDGIERTFCMNTFQGAKLSENGLFDVDAVLGASFLKNVYVSFDWGNETDGGTEGPFVQLLATTSYADSLAEFRQVREQTLKSLPKEVTPSEFARLVERDGGAF